MKLENLPKEDDWDAILKLVQSFNGYLYFESFEESSRQAKLKKRKTLIDLQNELFNAYRAGNHLGEKTNLLYAYAELKPYFERLLR
jgi:hypothetical protein